jgi:ComB9 competence protein
MNRAAGLPMGQIQGAWDSAPDNAGVYTVPYRPDQVVRVRTRLYMTTTIVLPSWENIGDFIIGDDMVFSARKIRSNVLVVRAQHIGADATLTVVGERSGWIYPFYLRAEGTNSKTIPDVTVYVKATPPLAVEYASRAEAQAAAIAAANIAAATGDGPIPPKAGAPAGTAAGAQPGEGPRGLQVESGVEDPDYLKPIKFDPALMSFDFSMSGDRSIAPVRVFEDGLFTYFDYGDKWDGSDLPAVYRVVDGIDTPQNPRYRGSMIIVESTGDFTLRNGQRVVCVRKGTNRDAPPKVEQRRGLSPEAPAAPSSSPEHS